MKNAVAQLASRNPLAACLSHGAYAPKRVRAAKGKGSFKRSTKHRSRDFA